MSVQPPPPDPSVNWLVPLGMVGSAIVGFLSARFTAVTARGASKDVAVVSSETTRITAEITAETARINAMLTTAGTTEAAALSAMTKVLDLLNAQLLSVTQRADRLEVEVEQCHDEGQETRQTLLKSQADLLLLHRKYEECQDGHETLARELAAALHEGGEMRADLNRVKDVIDERGLLS